MTRGFAMLRFLRWLATVALIAGASLALAFLFTGCFGY